MKTTTGLKTFAVLLVVFLCTVFLRLPDINRPLSKHHEFTTSFVLRIQQIWWQRGALTFHCNPVMNYSGAANKFINNQTFSDFDADGNSYYISYPAGAYLFPYLIFKLFNIYPDVLPLQIYNMMLQFIAGLLFFLLLKLLFPDKENSTFIFVLGTIVFWTSACCLWFFSNVYMVDMPAAVFMLATVYFLLKWINTKQKVFLIFLLGANAMMNYTEYLGITFSVCAAAYLFIERKKIKRWFTTIAVLFFSAVIPLTIMVWQYSMIKGWNYYKWFFQQRYQYRSGYDQPGNVWEKVFHIFNEWKIIGGNYIIGFLPLLLAILILIFLTRKSNQRQRKEFVVQISFLFLFPVLLHHTVFLNASLYDFFVVKTAPFLAIVFVWLILKTTWQPKFILSIALAICLSSIMMYYFINRPGKISQSGEPYASFQVKGKFIADHAENNEVIFLQKIADDPQLVFYAQRNLRTIETEDEAVDFLKKHHQQNGIIFCCADGNALSIKRIHVTE